MALLEIRNLHVNVEDKPILKGLNLTMDRGEVHAIMGPNGAGKSTLSYVIAGRDGYEVTDGQILFDGKDLLEMEADERACAGLFLAFQYPVEIPGVTNTTFLKTALNSVRKARGEGELDAMQFLKYVRGKAKPLGIGDDMLKRGVNVGFSGGGAADGGSGAQAGGAGRNGFRPRYRCAEGRGGRRQRAARPG
jgi:Fe-S cluster assembly ATP-binding protein